MGVRQKLLFVGVSFLSSQTLGLAHAYIGTHSLQPLRARELSLEPCKLGVPVPAYVLANRKPWIRHTSRERCGERVVCWSRRRHLVRLDMTIDPQWRAIAAVCTHLLQLKVSFAICFFLVELSPTLGILELLALRHGLQALFVFSSSSLFASVG